MNKYLEALNRLRNETIPSPFCEQHNDRDFDIVQELVDKQTPLTVNYISDGYADGYPVYDTAICPNCTRIFEVFDEEHYKYCPTCGQHLNWSEESE